MSRPPVRAVALTGVAVCGLTACSGAHAGERDGLTVAVTSYPLEYVTEQVGGEHVTVQNLTQRGGGSHGLEPTPRVVLALAEADVVIHLRRHAARGRRRPGAAADGAPRRRRGPRRPATGSALLARSGPAGRTR